MPIEVEGPDGKVHTFPDGTQPSDINAQMSATYKTQGSLRVPQVRAGSATAASGAVMPGMQAMPAYRTNEDWDQLMLSQMFPHATGVIQNTPGHAARMEHAKAVGKDVGQLEEKQRAGSEILDMLDMLGETADEGHKEGSLGHAIGPANASETFQRVRALVPGVSSYYEKGYNLHNRLMHDVHGMTTAFISASNGMKMSDARQREFSETMGAMMKATNYDEFNKIKADAQRIIKKTFALQPGVSIPQQGSGRAETPAAPVRQQFRNKSTGAVETFEMTPQGWRKVQ